MRKLTARLLFAALPRNFGLRRLPEPFPVPRVFWNVLKALGLNFPWAQWR